MGGAGWGRHAAELTAPGAEIKTHASEIVIRGPSTAAMRPGRLRLGRPGLCGSETGIDLEVRRAELSAGRTALFARLSAAMELAESPFVHAPQEALARPYLGNKGPGLTPIRAITRGPRFHWFGYYDKFQFDTRRGASCSETRSILKAARQPPRIRFRSAWWTCRTATSGLQLGETNAWNWQQGCMLQWLPGSVDEVMWNDREGDHFVCRILDVKTGAKRTLPAPVYTVSPDGLWVLAPDFSSAQRLPPWLWLRSVAPPIRIGTNSRRTMPASGRSICRPARRSCSSNASPRSPPAVLGGRATPARVGPGGCWPVSDRGE